MKLTHIHYILSLGTLVTSASIKKHAELIARAGETILKEADLVEHWADNRQIAAVKENIQIQTKDGKLYPLIELDCLNLHSGTRSYQKDYKQVCTNFCFNRYVSHAGIFFETAR